METYRKVVLDSAEYKAYAEERRRPLPPLEMSLLTRILIASCLTLEPRPPQPANKRARVWEEAQTELPEQVVRKSDRAREGIHTSSGLPDKDGNYKDGDSKEKVLEFDKDPNRILVCNMQHSIASAATLQFGPDWRGPGGSAGEEDQAIWNDLVEAETRGETTEEADKNRTKYVARAVLGLIQLLASVLRYLFG